ncbi:hypothetical protein INR49_023201 [Caranx melampygus]|nr:hypothetical protein INR49_023201 [Caranx melampygus]
MRDDTYKGRGKYHSKRSSAAMEQEIRERATVLQTEFENFVHSDAQTLQNAKRGTRPSTCLQHCSPSEGIHHLPAHLKHIFHIRSLHLGHTAKSFGLRDAPQGLSSATTPWPHPPTRPGAKRQDRTPTRRCGPGLREVDLLRSEFSSGLDGGGARRRRRRRQLASQERKRRRDEEEQQLIVCLT